MDNFYLNLSMYRLEEFLKSTTNPHYADSFKWGRPMIGHEYYGYEPWPLALLQEMAAHITRNTPEGEDAGRWKYR